MANERLAPDALLELTNLTGAVTDIDDDPDSADASWLTQTGSNGIVRVSFPTPSGTPTTGAGLQEFRFQLRKNASGGGTPTYQASLYESGSEVLTLASAQSVTTSDPGSVFSHTWNASSLSGADGSNVELRLTFTSNGGGPNVRHIEVGAIEWNAETTAASGLTLQPAVYSDADAFGTTFVSDGSGRGFFLDGDNDWLIQSSTIFADSDTLAISIWVRPEFQETFTELIGADNHAIRLLCTYVTASSGAKLGVSTNVFGVGPGINYETQGAVLFNNQWTHIFASFDIGNVLRHITIDGVEQPLTVTTWVSSRTGNFDDSPYYIGRRYTTASGSTWKGGLGEVWISATAGYMPPEDVKKFFINNSPVRLGVSGAGPTGTPPNVYLTGYDVINDEASNGPAWTRNGNGIVYSTAMPAFVEIVSAATYINTNVFGTPTISQAGETLAPIVYVDADVFGTAVVSAGPVTISPAVYADADAFPTAVVSAGPITIQPAVYVDADVFPTAVVSAGPVTLQPTVYADGDAFGTQLVSPGAVTISPTVYADGDVFGTPTVDSTVRLFPIVYEDADAFGTASVSAGPVTISPAIYADADVVGQPTLVATYNLQPAVYTDADAFGAPSLVYVLSPAAYADADQVGTPSLVYQLEPTVYTDGDVFGTPTLVGSGTLIAIVYEDPDEFPMAVVSGGAVADFTGGLSPSRSVSIGYSVNDREGVGRGKVIEEREVA